MKSTNSSDPRMDPCRTYFVIGTKLDLTELKETY